MIRDVGTFLGEAFLVAVFVLLIVGFSAAALLRVRAVATQDAECAAVGRVAVYNKHAEFVACFRRTDK